MELWPSKIPGCYEIQLKVFQDHRGKFVKTFHHDIFADKKLETNFAETYYSVSAKNVLRGLHFQIPPKDHVKLVHCLQGEILDAVVDLRVGSPTYGQHEIFRLSADQGNSVYIPAGLAHGFYILSEQATVIYQVSTVYAPEYEQGILWNSAGIPWPTSEPSISQKDSNWRSLADFKSPFVYNTLSVV